MLENWLSRHRNRTSLLLHIVGIPATIAAVVLAAVQLLNGQWHLWWRPTALLLGGYALQFLGHAIEGNDPGELCLLKRLLGKPYRPFADRPAVLPKGKKRPAEDDRRN